MKWMMKLSVVGMLLVVGVLTLVSVAPATYMLADQVLSSIYQEAREQISVTTASGVTPSITSLVASDNVEADTYRVELTNALRYENFSLEMVGAGGITFTLWYSLDSTADTDADTGWIDVTSDLCGAASIADDTAVCIQNVKLRGRYMVKYVAADATNSVDVFYLPF